MPLTCGRSRSKPRGATPSGRSAWRPAGAGAQPGRARGLHRAPGLRADRLHLGRRPFAAARAREPLRPRPGRRARRAAAQRAGVRVLGARGVPAAVGGRAALPARQAGGRPRSTAGTGRSCRSTGELADEVMAVGSRARRDLLARLRRGGQGLLGVDAAPSACWTRSGRRASSRSRGAAGMERRYALPERVLPAGRCSGAPEPSLEATRRMQVERAVRARGIASEARVSDYFRVKGKRRTLAPAIEELVAGGVLERVRMRELGDTWLVPAEDAERAIAGDERPTGRLPALAVRQPAVGSLRGRAPVRLRAPAGDLQARAHAHLRLLRAAAARRPRGRRPGRHEGRPQGRYAAGPGSALAAAASGRGRLREALARLAHVLGLERSEIQSGV